MVRWHTNGTEWSWRRRAAGDANSGGQHKRGDGGEGGLGLWGRRGDSDTVTDAIKIRGCLADGVARYECYQQMKAVKLTSTPKVYCFSFHYWFSPVISSPAL